MFVANAGVVLGLYTILGGWEVQSSDFEFFVSSKFLWCVRHHSSDWCYRVWGGGFVIKDDFWVELEDTNLRLANVELDGPRDDYDRTRGSSLGD